ncbi:hypothetical protein [Pseudomonas phage pPA-3099-2aT.2]|uniref:Uncharacterized protein n=1 Tax=Pseudomonas phage pPA-3099-2aT.2 TaxID=3003808 RepID=A0AAF0AT25_9CAUD|nr:hypothetical protein QE325_gp136 [Pseudomonas phage pPA-3099-2aT.2]WBQ35245.1 hypothetical protein [Pseudomonas phage pPA-3099-2aT.2]
METMIIRLDTAYGIQTIRAFLLEAVRTLTSALVADDEDTFALVPNHCVAILYETPDGHSDSRMFRIEVFKDDVYKNNPRMIFTDADSPGFSNAGMVDSDEEFCGYAGRWQHIRLEDYSAMTSLSDWATLLASSQPGILTLDRRPVEPTTTLHP